MVGMKVTASKVANVFLKLAQEKNEELTNLKLQKLVYYAQAWYLAIYEKPLFDDEIEAWIHGPAVPSIYKMYKKFGWKPITTLPQKVILPKNVKEHIAEVMDIFGKF